MGEDRLSEWQNDAATVRQVGGTHYTEKKIQPWEAMEAWSTPEEFKGHLRLTAIKYLSSRNKPGGTDVEEIRKAIHYLQKLVEVELKT